VTSGEVLPLRRPAPTLSNRTRTRPQCRFAAGPFVAATWNQRRLGSRRRAARAHSCDTSNDQPLVLPWTRLPEVRASRPPALALVRRALCTLSAYATLTRAMSDHTARYGPPTQKPFRHSTALASVDYSNNKCSASGCWQVWPYLLLTPRAGSALAGAASISTVVAPASLV
jgi:hypothetical protein